MFHTFTRPSILASLLALTLVVSPQLAFAHFLWIIPPTTGSDEFQLVFSEGLQADDPELLKRLVDAKVRLYDAAGHEREVGVELKDDRLVGKIPADFKAVAIDCQQTWGMFSRGNAEFLLKYRATSVLNTQAMSKVQLPETAELGPLLTLIPESDGLKVTARFQGKPLAKETVAIQGPEAAEVALDDSGIGHWSHLAKGLYGLRIKASEDAKGEWQGKAYAQVRHYTTVSIGVGSGEDKGQPSASKEPGKPAKVDYPELPQSITSFGAAKIGEALYVYGGHTGRAHSYSNVGQMKEVLKLDLQHLDKGWQTVTESERLQGLGMVAYGTKLIVAGGFNARNAEGDKQDLHSTAAVSVFDTKTNEWSKLPNLPEPRSSHDVAIIGDTVYVVGGWQLRSPEESHWHTTAWALNLKETDPKWTAIAAPTFERRAVAAIGHANKLYVIGGMNRDGGTTRDVEIYDPVTNSWTHGPAIDGEKPLAGFGVAAISMGSDLYVTNMEGTVQKLIEDGSKWKIVGTTDDARFFHRLLPVNDHQVIAVGGASMESGKFAAPELIKLP